MPIYEYSCRECSYQFERMQKFSDPPETICPQCNGDVQKLISQSTFHLKGTGWYVTDYAKKSSSASSADGKNEATGEAKVEAKKDTSSTSSTPSSGSDSGTSSGTGGSTASSDSSTS